jgi:hypothetical protein
MKYVLLILGLVIAVSLTIELVRSLRTYFKFRGKRIVSCPETHEAAAVSVAAAKAAAQAAVGAPHLALSDCSRWPEKEACGQECLEQVEEAPKACLVNTIVNQWYAGQKCVFCRQPFHEIHWHDHPPALVDERKRTIEWKDVPPEKLQEVFKTHLPVCWSCHVTETFRRTLPELVVDRPVH